MTAEVLKHESVELVDHVDLDGEVIEVCRQHFAWGHVWDDPRVRLHITDGAAFVRKAKTNFYDVIIQDSSDPWTWDDNGDKVVLPSSALYSKSHFENIHRVLAPGGILNLQAESLQIPSDLEGAIKWREVALEVGFHSARYCSIMISSYPTGQIGCLLCEKAEPVSDLYRHIQERFAKIQRDGRGTTYYHPKLQSSAFDLPLWAEQLIYGDNRESSPLCADGHVLTE